MNVISGHANRQIQTDHATPSVAIDRILCTECFCCGLMIITVIMFTVL